MEWTWQQPALLQNSRRTELGLRKTEELFQGQFKTNIMKVKTLISTSDNRYRVEISVYDFSAVEEELVSQFGEPIIEIGGSFAGSETRPGEAVPTTVNFELPAEQRRWDSDFPVVKIFDLDDDVDSDVKAKVFGDEIVSRLQTAKNALVAQSAAFTGETTITI